ncbi:hypothetical protein B7494_g2948 [Chlorociboria aeruginascens]|nr:hypothetical protein B7494_g2948 [Chlorociboria aeruginascens]
MLGRLRMSVDECEMAYLNLAQNIFKFKRKGLNFFARTSDFLQANGKFSTEALEATIKEIVRSKSNGENTLLLDDPVSPCKIFVCAATASTSTKTVLRSYKPHFLPDFISEKCTIWEAGRATSAATGLFEPIKIGSCGQTFVDGAITYMNPVQLVYDEAQDIFGQERTENAMLVSIGTGRAPLKPFRGNLKNIVGAMKRLMVDSQKAHDDFSSNHRKMIERNLFVRFNVYPGLEDVGIHEYEQTEKIEAATQAYLHDGETQRVFNRCIQTLLLEPRRSTTNLNCSELPRKSPASSTPDASWSGLEPEFQDLPISSATKMKAVASIPYSSEERITDLPRAQYSDSSRFHALDEGRSLLDQQDLKGAKEHFARILAHLQESHGEHGQFLRVYRALTILELNMTFGKLSVEEKKQRLQTAIFYSDKAFQVARSYVTDRGELALVKLQRAVVNGRRAQLDARQAQSGDSIGRNWKSVTVGSINSALDELRLSNHEGFQDSQMWALEWLQNLGCQVVAF